MRLAATSSPGTSDARTGRWTRRTALLSVVTVCAALAVPLVVDQGRASAATLLLAESFTNGSVADANYSVIGNTAAAAAGLPCLTAGASGTGTPIPTCQAGQLDLPAGGDPVGGGALRLTDATGNEGGALLYNKPLPLADGADINFDFAQYGGTSKADGINFFLADGATPLTAPGASGGSLGYAQKTTPATPPAPGVTNGFLGLGLDEYGNYELNTEGRGSTGGSAMTSGTVTCPESTGTTRTANQVGLRGPGTGFDNYCLLGAAKLDPATQSLHGTGTTHLAPGTLESARIVVDPSTMANPQVTVYLAFNQTATDSVTPTQVLQVPEPANAPNTFRFGIAASTGGSTDIHEILNLRISTVSNEPVYSIAQQDTTGQVFDAGTQGTFTITPRLQAGTNETYAPVVTETLPAGTTLASNPTPTGYTCNGAAGDTTFTCTYTGTLPIAAGSTLPTINVPVNVTAAAGAKLVATASIVSTDSSTATGTDAVTIAAKPVAVTDAYSTNAGKPTGVPATLDVITNDTGSGLTVTAAAGAQGGTLAVSADKQSVTYTPNSGFSGKDTFTYSEVDPRGQTSTVTDTVLVKPVGADDVTYATPFKTVDTVAAAAGVLANDTGSTLVVTAVDGKAVAAGGTATVTGTNGGSFVVSPTGAFTFTPTATEAGADSFTYTATDGTTPYTQTATVTVGKPAAPAAVADPFVTGAVSKTAPGTPVTVAVTANDTGTGTLTPVVATQPLNGKAVVSGTSIVYTPNAGFSGSDPFTYYVTDPYGTSSSPVTEPVTVKPLGADDPNYTTGFNTVETVSTAAGVLTNDVGTGLRVTTVNGTPVGTAVATSLGGSVTVAANGSFVFTPSATESGVDTFSYTATDGTSTYSQLATVTVGKPAPPVAKPESFTTTAVPATATTGNSVTLPVVTNGSGGTDTGTGTLTPVVTVQPKNGKAVATGSGPTATITYTANPGFSGSDPFSYAVDDTYGQQSVAVVEPVTVTPVGADDPGYQAGVQTPLNQAAAGGLLTNDVGTGLTVVGLNGVPGTLTAKTTSGGSVTVKADGSFVFTPIAAEYGPDTFTYLATDGTTTYSQTATVTVARPAVPTAPNDSKQVAAYPVGGPATSVTLAGSSAAISAPGSTVTRTSPVNGGTVTAGATAGTFVYTPKAGYSGPDSFTYTVTDPTGQTATGTETVTVLPAAVNDTLTDNFPSPASVTSATLVANDAGSGLTVTSVSAKSTGNGTVALSPDGKTVTYTPPAAYVGTDSFTYTATDSNGKTTTASVTVTLNKPTAPTAAPQSAATTTGVNVTPAAETNLLTGSTGTGDSVVAQPAGTKTTKGGTVTVATDGSYTYAPPSGFSGIDTFPYQVVDVAGTKAGNTVTVTVSPVAKPDGPVNVTYNTPLTAPGASLTANDLGSGLTLATVGGTGKTGTSTGGGTVVLNGNASFTYTPKPGFTGADSFTYTAVDSNGLPTNSTTVSLNVLPPKPVATDDPEPAIPANGSLTVAAPGILANDTGTGVLTPTLVTKPVNGTVTTPLPTDGSFVYTPKTGFSGTDSFTYQVTDPQTQVSNTATVTLTVTPVAKPDSRAVAASTTLQATVPSPIGNAITSYQVVTGPADATAFTLDPATGAYSYTPKAGFNGNDSFTYTVTGAGGTSQQATISLVVAKPGVPTGQPDSVTTSAGVATSTTDNGPSLLSNDSGEKLTIPAGSYTQPTHGTVAVNTDGTFTYTPTGTYSGPDTFTYTPVDDTNQPTAQPVTVSVTVKPIAAPASAKTTADQPVTFTVPTPVGTPGNGFGYQVTTQPQHGTLTPNGSGSFTYKPDPAFTGSDSFTYTVTDGNGIASDPKTVSLTVGQPDPPVAVNDSYATSVDTTLTVPASTGVLGNDSGDPTLTPTLVAGSAVGGTPTLAADGSFTFVPTPGTSGKDSFGYTITDNVGQPSAPATVSVIVSPTSQADSYPLVGGAPYTATTSLLANDDGTKLTVATTTQPGHGKVSVNADGTFVYTPDPTFAGTDTFTYQAKDADGDLGPVTTVTLTVAKPAPPVGQPDQATGVAGAPVTVADVLTNDGGVGDTVGSFTQPANGTVAPGSAAGTFTYTPATGFSGNDTFTYTPVDQFGQPGTPVTVTVAVAPSALPDSQSVRTGTTLSASVPTPVGTAPFTYTVTTTPAHGTLTLDPATGAYAYTPSPGYLGPDSFAYTVTDPAKGTSLPATISLTVVTPVAPAGAPDSAVTFAGKPVSGNVLGNDAGTAPLTAAVAAAPKHGTVTVNPDGSYTYTPAAGFSGTDTFTYTVTDTFKQVSAPVTVTVTVSPVAAPDSGSIIENTTGKGPSVLGNDTGTGLTAALAAPPAHGTLVLNPDGTYSYTPTTGYSGSDSFSYVAVDAAGNRSAAVTVTLTVTPAIPVITGGTTQTVPVGGTLAPITVSDPDGSKPTVTTSKPGSLPPGVTLSPSGALTGKPTKAGTYTFPVTVTSPTGNVATTTVTVTVTAPKVIAAAPISTVTNVGAGLALPQVGGTIVKVTGQLPPGVRVLGDRLVGTPSKVGVYHATLTIKVAGKTITRRLTITVRPVQAVGRLAFTGAGIPVGGALGLALALVTLGGLLLTVGRRRRRA